MALTPAAAELNKELNRVLGNIAKRNTRLKQKDVKGGNLVTERTDAKIEEIRSTPRSNYGEIKSALAQARKLNKSAGTWAKSFQKAAKRAYNDDLVDRAKDPNNIIRMTKDELTETFTVQRSRLRDRIRSVKKSINGNNFMTHIAEDLLAEYDPKTADHNKLRSLVNRTSKYLDTKTLTVQGANDHIEKGVQLVGEQYRSWSDAQRTAFWEAVHREMELSGLSSVESIEVVRTAMSDQKMVTLFDEAPDGKLRAVIDQSLSGAKAKLARLKASNERGRKYLREGFEKHGAEVPESLRSFLYGDEEDQPFFF
jgi:hypothetical protein